jgi:hypothetical protein
MALAFGQYETATTWLDRALMVCESWVDDTSDKPNLELKDKKLLILHAYGENSDLALTF